MALKPRAASDNTGWKWIRLFDPKGVPDFHSIHGYVWRDDHQAVMTRFLRKTWSTILLRQRLQGIHEERSVLLRYLDSLPEIQVVETGYDVTPEAEGQYALPHTYNVVLAGKLVAELLKEHRVEEEKATLAARRLVEELVEIGFVPLFDGPDPTVDGLVIGSGVNAEKALLLIDDQGRHFLPGAVLRYGESVTAAMQRALWEKAKMDATPLHFAGLAGEWPKKGEQHIPRDPRGTSVDYLYVLQATSPADTKTNHVWFPLWDGNGDFNRKIFDLPWRYHHETILAKVADDLVMQGIYQPFGSESLLEAVSARGLII